MHDEACTDETAVNQLRSVLDLLESTLHDPRDLPQVGCGEVAEVALDQRPDGGTRSEDAALNGGDRWPACSLRRYALPRRDITVQPIALFDLDDTLTDRAAAFAAWAEEFAAAHSIPEQWLHEADATHSGRRRDFFALAKAAHTLPGTVDEHYAEFRRRTPQLVPFRPAVNAAVSALADNGWQLAVVTNGDHDAQHAKLAAARLTGLLPTVVVSSDHGVRKPDPALFHTALAQLGASPEGAWVIGDSLAADIAGGLRAGLNTLWISHGRTHPGGPRPQHTAHSTVDACIWLLSRTGQERRR
ncbi:HAD family hydrolase [Streptomyces sp. NPDC058486]|uniref:HAD family hydrolase n=1 Tax=unclassified Streptomyces TaxID=2593676 RepID=UPI00365544C5